VGAAGYISNIIGNSSELEPLAKIVNNEEPYKDLAYNIFHAAADLSAGTCNVYGMEVERKGC
jgi:hypothetical protein